MEKLKRLWRHFVMTRWALHRHFPPATLDAVERAVHEGEDRHSGEVRFIVETDLDVWSLLDGKTARQRAIEMFSLFQVWDTELNNGVLVYVLFADHRVEILADRGLAARAPQAEWDAVCRLVEGHYRAGRWEQGSVEGVRAASAILERHFPLTEAGRARDRNELPDRPTLL